MIIVRVAAVLVLVAIVLALIHLITRKPPYLRWAWGVFVAALVCIVGVLGFYFFERVFL